MPQNYARVGAYVSLQGINVFKNYLVNLNDNKALKQIVKKGDYLKKFNGPVSASRLQLFEIVIPKNQSWTAKLI